VSVCTVLYLGFPPGGGGFVVMTYGIHGIVIYIYVCVCVCVFMYIRAGDRIEHNPPLVSAISMIYCIGSTNT
jgi:hypothetical protein